MTGLPFRLQEIAEAIRPGEPAEDWLQQIEQEERAWRPDRAARLARVREYFGPDALRLLEVWPNLSAEQRAAVFHEAGLEG